MTDSIVYHGEAWSQLYREWLAEYTATPQHSISVKQQAASGSYKLQFVVKHSASSLNYAQVSQAMRNRFGPLVELVSCEPRSLQFGVSQMPEEAAKALSSTFRNATRLIERGSKKRLALLAFVFFTSNAAAAAFFLYRHWQFYNEPWNGVLEFVKYHMQG